MPASCVANACASSGIFVDDHVDDRRVVEDLPRLGFSLETFRFRQKLLLDDFRFRLSHRKHFRGLGPADLLDLGGLAGALELQLPLRRLGTNDSRLLLAFGAKDGRLSFRFGGLDDRRLQFLLAARRFLRLNEHFLLLANLVDARFLLGDLLTRDRRSPRPGLLGLRLFCLHRCVELRLPRFLVAQRLRDSDVGFVALGLALLVGHRRFDHRVALSESLADDGIALDLGGPPFAQGIEVLLLVADLLNRQDVDVDTHFLEIDRGLVCHLLREDSRR